MNLDDFLYELRLVTDEEGLTWVCDGAIRGWKDDDDDMTWYDKPFCPVTAVAYHLTGDWYPTSSACLAAERIGLSKGKCLGIIEVSDRDFHTTRRLKQLIINSIS